jgi:hypothetical protein
MRDDRQERMRLPQDPHDMIRAHALRRQRHIDDDRAWHSSFCDSQHTGESGDDANSRAACAEEIAQPC